MAAEEIVSFVLAVEAIFAILLMTFNGYFLTQKPILHYIREIHYVNSRKFQQAWYLVISATTFFLLDQVVAALAQKELGVSIESAATGHAIFTLSFATLMILAFAIVFRIFAPYVPRLRASEKEIRERIARDLIHSLLQEDGDLRLGVDLHGFGDVVTERRQLGPYISLSHYRALTAAFVAYTEQKLGLFGDAVLYEVGRLVSRQATQEVLRDLSEPDRALEQMLVEIRQNLIGLPEVQSLTEQFADVVIHENAPAAGIQPIGRPVCHYQAGMLAGIFEGIKGVPAWTQESACWGLGDRFCRFRVEWGGSGSNPAYRKTYTTK